MYFRISETIFELNAGRSRDSFTLQIGLGKLSNSAIQSRSSFAENKYKGDIMADKGKRDKGKREQPKKAKLTLKERRKQKREKKK